MNKFKPLFDIPLAKYNNLNKYPPADKIKRVLEAHLINYLNTLKKLTASNNPPVTTNNITTGNKNNKSKNNKRKRNDNKNKDKLSKLSGRFFFS